MQFPYSLVPRCSLLPSPATSSPCRELSLPGGRPASSRALCCSHQHDLSPAGCRVSKARAERWWERGSCGGAAGRTVSVSCGSGNNLFTSRGKIMVFLSRSLEPRLKLKCCRDNPCPEQLALFQGCVCESKMLLCQDLLEITHCGPFVSACGWEELCSDGWWYLGAPGWTLLPDWKVFSVLWYPSLVAARCLRWCLCMLQCSDLVSRRKQLQYVSCVTLLTAQFTVCSKKWYPCASVRFPGG